MAKLLDTLIGSLATPAIALITMLVTAIFAFQLPVIVCWPITVAMFGLLLAWQRSLRRTYFESQAPEINSDQIAVVRAYAITYAILYAALLAGALCSAYFGLGLPYIVPCFASWFIRRDVWLAFLIHALDMKGKSIHTSA